MDIKETKSNEYELNNIIIGLIDVIEKKDKIIVEMAKDLMSSMTSTATLVDIIEHYEKLCGLRNWRIY